MCDYFLKVYQGLAIKTVRWRERHSFQFMRAVFCSVWTARAQTAASLTPRDAWTGKYMKYVKLPLLASNFSNNSSILNLYTEEQMHRFILEHLLFRAHKLHCRHSGAAHIHSVYTIHTHTIVWALTMLENGTSDTCRLIAWSIDVKHYIARGPFVTASQTTQNNKPKLTKRCTPQSASLPPSRDIRNVLFPINEAVTSSLHSNYSFFAEIIT